MADKKKLLTDDNLDNVHGGTKSPPILDDGFNGSDEDSLARVTKRKVEPILKNQGNDLLADLETISEGRLKKEAIIKEK